MTSALPTGSHINLQLGWPSPALFPASQLSAGATTILSEPSTSASALIYGPNPGYAPLRREIARWLGSEYYADGAAIPESRVCVSNGASATLANALLRFADPTYTRRVWMVEPTYFLACPIFEDCGFAGRMRGVPEDEEGIDLAFLRAALEAADAEWEAEKGGDSLRPRYKTPDNGYEKIYKHVLYVVPTFSNPSGKTMSLRRRRELVRLAVEFDVLVISDDVYDFLYWPEEKGGPPVDRTTFKLPPRLVDVNRELDPESKWGNTMSNGSFSKIVAPGVRVSWVEATPAFASFLANTGSTWSGGNPGHVSSTFVSQMLSSGALEKHIKETLVPCYEARYHAMVDAIKEYLMPLGVRITTGKPYEAEAADAVVKTAGGFFLLITLPPTGFATVPVLAKLALEKHDLKFAYGKMFEVKGDAGSKQRSEQGFGSTIRLCWAYHNETEIVEGIKRMKMLLEENRV